jgi:hypothetical protein
VVSLFVNTSYEVGMTIDHNKHRSANYKWNFITNNVGTTHVMNNEKTREREARSCQPTNAAENYILNGIQARMLTK